MKLDTICDVPGLKVGHFSNYDARTGCTVVLPDAPALAAVDVRGSAPGTREVELLKTVRLVQQVHAILLTGGSAFGLNAAAGVQKYLEERGIGFQTPDAVVPIVPTAVIYDLGVGDPSVRPDADAGYQACTAATAQPTFGRVGVGCGATVGKVLGQESASGGGVGSSSERVGSIIVGAMTVVNCFGEVIDPTNGRIVAGARADKNSFVPTLEVLKKSSEKSPFEISNTTLSVVATNVFLNREQATKVAQMAQDGFAKTIRPAHTMYDGDIVFVLSTGSEKGDVNLVGGMACEVVAESIVGAVAG